MSTKNFVQQVREYQAKHKSSRSDAMRAVARTDPAAHQAFLESGQTDFFCLEDESKDFMALVDDYQTFNGCSRVESMLAIARRFPNKHREFIDSANQ